MMKKTQILLLTSVLFSMVALWSCIPSITMSGASIPENLNTFSVEYIVNRAPLVNPELSSELTEGLKNRIQKESRLLLTEDQGDIVFSGTITGYGTQPMALKADAESAKTRLTINVKIKCRNYKDPKKDWEQSFSVNDEYDSDYNLSDVEGELVEKLVEQLTENIFNKAFADW